MKRGGVLFVLLLALAVALNQRLEQRDRKAALRHSLYLPSGDYLGFASLGNRNLLADLLYIWSIQYYSSVRDERWRYLQQLYDVITDLDPRFVTAYSIGSLILENEARQPWAALRLLERGIERNPDTYLLAFEAGFMIRKTGDLARASEFYRKAAAAPDAPDYVERWYRFTLGKAGRNEEALALWQEAYDQAPSAYERQVAEGWIRFLRTEIGREQLDGSVAAFRAAEGRLPRGLDELVRRGLLKELPIDGYGQPFEYDRDTGEVQSGSGWLEKRRWRR